MPDLDASPPSPIPATPPEPAVGAQVVYAGVSATVTRVHRPGDPDSPIDLAHYPGGTARFETNVRHGLGEGWAWPAEVAERRRAEMAGDGADGIKVGSWVRFARRERSGGQGIAGGRSRLQVLRGRVAGIEPGGAAGADPIVRVKLFPLDPPHDPSTPDEPLPEAEMILHALDSGNVAAVEAGHVNRYEPIDGRQLFETQWTAEVFAFSMLTDCDLCSARMVSPSTTIGISAGLFVPGSNASKFYQLCRDCSDRHAAMIEEARAKRAAAMATRRVDCPIDPRTVVIGGVELFDEHSPRPMYLNGPEGDPTHLGARLPALEKMAETGNAEAEAGRPPTLTIGHLPHAASGRTVRVVGHVQDLRVGRSATTGAAVLVGDLHLKRSHIREASAHPRISIERRAPRFDALSGVALVDRPARSDLALIDWPAVLAGL